MTISDMTAWRVPCFYAVCAPTLALAQQEGCSSAQVARPWSSSPLPPTERRGAVEHGRDSLGQESCTHHLHQGHGEARGVTAADQSPTVAELTVNSIFDYCYVHRTILEFHCLREPYLRLVVVNGMAVCECTYRPCSKRLAFPDPPAARSRWPEPCQGVQHMWPTAKKRMACIYGRRHYHLKWK